MIPTVLISGGTYCNIYKYWSYNRNLRVISSIPYPMAETISIQKQKAYFSHIKLAQIVLIFLQTSTTLLKNCSDLL